MEKNDISVRRWGIFWYRSKGVCPRPAVREAFLLLETSGHFSELFLVKTDFELLRNVLVFVAVRFIIATPLREFNILLHKNSLLNELRVIFCVDERIMLEVFEILFKVCSYVFAVVAAIDHLSGCLFSFL